MRSGGAEECGTLRELASGIDALYLSGRAVLPEEFLAELEAKRAEAVEANQERPFAIGSCDFRIAPHGFGKYRFCLKHRFGQIGLTASTHLPALRVQPRSECLHGLGALGTVEWFDHPLGEICGPIRWSVSRLDLYSDWQGWELSGDDRHDFVCRSTSVDTHERNHGFAGLEFGRRSSKTVCARIYDKTLQTAETGAGFWNDIWGPRRVEDLPVIRVEFEFGRQGLQEFDVDTPQQAILTAPSLWVYATDSWLSLRSATADLTRSRWPITPEWNQIRHSSLAGGAFGIDRMYRGRQIGTLAGIEKGLIGFVSTFGALIGTVALSDTCKELERFIKHHEHGSPITFGARISDKRRSLPWV